MAFYNSYILTVSPVSLLSVLLELTYIFTTAMALRVVGQDDLSQQTQK
jgi:hypothetical protein